MAASRNPSRNYMFTIFDLAWSFNNVDLSNVKYIIANTEVCPKTSRWHRQGYIELKGTHRIPGAKAILGCDSAHLDPRYGTQEQAIHYCKKPIPDCKCDKCTHQRNTNISAGAVYEEGKTWIEHGVATKQGKRTDLDEVAEDVKEGMDLADITGKHTAMFIKYHKGIERAIEVLEESKMIIPLPNITLRPWQVECNEYIDQGFVKRRILVIHSVESETGKSTYFDWLCATHGRAVLPGAWKLEDILYALKPHHKMIIFNVPRDVKLHDTHFAVLESVSDGGAKLAGKYGSRPKAMFLVVIVLMNESVTRLRKRLPKRIISWNLDSDEPKAVTLDPPVDTQRPALMINRPSGLSPIEEVKAIAHS